MVSDNPDAPVRDNPAQRRYEMAIGDQIGLIAYRLAGDTIDLTHTEVPEELAGHGIAARLARFALDDAAARGLRVIPSCPYVAAYIRRHPEYQRLVAPRPDPQ